MFRRVVIPTKDVVETHLATFDKLDAAGISPFALSQFLLDEVIHTPEHLEFENGNVSELVLGMIDFFEDSMNLDVSKIDDDLFHQLCPATGALISTLLKYRGVMTQPGENGFFVSGVTQQRWMGPDMVVLVELSSTAGVREVDKTTV